MVTTTPPRRQDLADATPSMRIRDAQPSDAEDIAAIGRAGFPAVHSGHVPEEIVQAAVAQAYGLADLRTCIATCLTNPDRHFLVAEAAGRVAGFVHYEGDRDEPELMRIYLDPARIGSGLGRQLVEALEARLARGTSYILLVLASNLRARRFYARRGLVVERVVDGPKFFAEHMGIELPERDPVDACVMRRTLPG